MAGVRQRLLLWVAEGLGLGRVPLAPGTWGSALGLPLFAGLLTTGNLVLYFVGTATVVALAVPICGRAESLLGRQDPSSVVLDEIAAVPLCYGGWVMLESVGGRLPVWNTFFQGASLWLLLVGFAVFRILDAVKPPPIGACQRLPGGWGIVADDLVAGVLTGILVGCARGLGLGS